MNSVTKLYLPFSLFGYVWTCFLLCVAPLVLAHFNFLTLVWRLLQCILFWESSRIAYIYYLLRRKEVLSAKAQNFEGPVLWILMLAQLCTQRRAKMGLETFSRHIGSCSHHSVLLGVASLFDNRRIMMPSQVETLLIMGWGSGYLKM